MFPAAFATQMAPSENLNPVPNEAPIAFQSHAFAVCLTDQIQQDGQ